MCTAQEVTRAALLCVFSRRSVFTINIAQTLDSDEVVRAKLNLIDLAGSERLSKTGLEDIGAEEVNSYTSTPF